MRTPQTPLHRQRGVATLLTSLMVLFVITLITLYAAQSTVMETTVSANQYRSDQAYAAASAAMDYAEARNASKAGDYPSTAPLNFTVQTPLASQELPARMFYCNPDDLDPGGGGTLPTGETLMANLGTLCPAHTSAQMTGAEGGLYANQIAIVAIGFSDDSAARRVMIHAAASLPVISNGPSSPLSTYGAVNVTGNVTVINRYKSFTVWSGKQVAMGNSVSAETFISNPMYDWSQYDMTSDSGQFAEYSARVDDDPGNDYTSQASNKQKGNNFDVVDYDPNLGNRTPDEFWQSFFADDKEGIKEMAQDNGQYFTSVPANLASLTGLVWIEGDADIRGGDYGVVPTVSDLEGLPIILVINGNLTTGGNTFVFGVLYSTGNWDTAGNVTIRGAAITEGIATAGTGNNKLIYDPKGFSGNAGGAEGAVVGSWRDW